MQLGNVGRGSALAMAAAGVVAVAVAAGVAAWVAGAGWPLAAPRDFEECKEVADKLSAGKEHADAIKRCDVRFPGRRKPGGGYVYYDLLQDKSFDIEGPVPTPDEQKRMDQAYAGYLGDQRRSDLGAEAARQQSERLRQAMEAARAADEPLVLTQPAPPPLPRRRPKTAPKADEPICVDGPLMCAWGKLRGVLAQPPAGKETGAAARASK